MAIPDKIKIQRIENYHTHYVGKLVDGRLIMAFVISTTPFSMPTEDFSLFSHLVEDERIRIYAVIYLFDKDGNRLDTIDFFAGTARDRENAESLAWNALDQKLAELGPIDFQDIKVKLFRQVLDDRVFGLIDSTTSKETWVKDGFNEEDWDPDKRATVTLCPNDLVFYPPWNGDFDT